MIRLLTMFTVAACVCMLPLETASARMRNLACADAMTAAANQQMCGTRPRGAGQANPAVLIDLAQCGAAAAVSGGVAGAACLGYMFYNAAMGGYDKPKTRVIRVQGGYMGPVLEIPQSCAAQMAPHVPPGAVFKFVPDSPGQSCESAPSEKMPNKEQPATAPDLNVSKGPEVKGAVPTAEHAAPQSPEITSPPLPTTKTVKSKQKIQPPTKEEDLPAGMQQAKSASMPKVVSASVKK